MPARSPAPTATPPDPPRAGPDRPLRCPNCRGADAHRIILYHPTWRHADDLAPADDLVEQDPPTDRTPAECRQETAGGPCGYRGIYAEFQLAASWAELDDQVDAGGVGEEEAEEDEEVDDLGDDEGAFDEDGEDDEEVEDEDDE